MESQEKIDMKQEQQRPANSPRLLTRGRVGAAVVSIAAVSGSMIAVAPVSGQASATASSVMISTANQKKVGTILESNGMTVYTLKPTRTACTASCLKIWPAVMLPAGVTAATAGPGVDASKLGTVARSGGLQVTYSGKALYLYYKDKVPGQVGGNLTDKWGKWATVVTAKSGSSGGTNTGGSGGTNTGTGGVSF
jgi:predicted lipoprotein with Yx(FWY)xxD motif